MRIQRGRKGMGKGRLRNIQRGRGMNVHRSNVRLQRGRGLGQLFAKFIPWVQPLISKIGPKLFTTAKTIIKSPVGKKVIQVAKESAKVGGAEVAGELIKGNKSGAKAAAKQHVGQARNKIGSLIKESGQPTKRPKGPPGKRKKGRRKKLAKSNFSKNTLL